MKFKTYKEADQAGELLVCTERCKPVSHIYCGLDFHGNRRCCCGGMFLTEGLVAALADKLTKNMEGSAE